MSVERVGYSAVYMYNSNAVFMVRLLTNGSICGYKWLHSFTCSYVVAMCQRFSSLQNVTELKKHVTARRIVTIPGPIHLGVFGPGW